MYTPGTLLRLAREERRLTVSDMKYFIRIRESAIIAMENDRFESFPAEYMRVFLPAYTDFLGVSHYKLAEAFKTTLPEHEHLTRSLYAQTLQQIATTQMEEEYNELHPALTAQLAKFAANHAFKALVVLCVCVLGWSVMGGVSTFGTLFANRFVATPEEMRGTPFVELAGELSSVKATESASDVRKTKWYSTEEQAEMKTVHLASLLNVDFAAVHTLAVKHGIAASYAVGDALVHAVEDLTLAAPKSAGYDASRRSVSSIASSMLARASDGNTAEQQEVGTISELSIEQNRLPVSSAKAAVHFANPEYPMKNGSSVLVEGVESISMRDIIAARKRVTMSLVALRSAMVLAQSAPVIESVELKPVPVPIAIVPAPAVNMNPSASWKTQQETVSPSHIIQQDIAKEILKSVVIPKVPIERAAKSDILSE